MRTSPSPIGARGLNATNLGTLELNKFEICKQYSGIVGPPVVFNFTVDYGNDGSVNETGTRTLSNGGCSEIHGPTVGSPGHFSDLVTVTEVTPAGYTVTFVKQQQTGGNVQTTNGSGPVASGLTIDIDGGALIVFTNTFNSVEQGDGRFTGGSADIELANGVVVGASLTIHCDKLLSNNLNVTWKDAQGNEHHFHMEDHNTTIECSDDPNIDQKPPTAPLDTLKGIGTGNFDGSNGGYTVEFTFVDTGEGGGKNDKIALKIFQTSNPSNIVLQFGLTDLFKGNLQAHFDQPHK